MHIFDPEIYSSRSVFMKRTQLIPAFVVVTTLTLATYTRAAAIIDPPGSVQTQRNRLTAKKLVATGDLNIKTVQQHLAENCFPEKNIETGLSEEKEKPVTPN